MPQTILNIAGGKIPPLDLKKHGPYFLVNVDTIYYQNADCELIELVHEKWDGESTKTYNVREDVFIFMERSAIWFDRVCVYRFLEHIPMDKVLYFIYLLSTVTQKGAEIDIIVPNYEILANMILSEPHNIANDVIDFEAHNIELTTELLNEPSCPHASIWTEWRASYFFGLEKRFKIIDACNHYDFDGRNIYLRFWAERL